MKISLFIIFVLIQKVLFCQIGIGTVTPHSSAIIEVHSNSKGVLLPRLSNLQKQNIQNPAEGLMIFNLDKKCIQVYTGENGNIDSLWVNFGIVEETFGNGNYTSDVVKISGGTFQMGSSTGNTNEQPIHSVILSDYAIGKYEVTNLEFVNFLNENNIGANGIFNGDKYIDIIDPDCQISHNGSDFIVDSGANNHPVIEVT